MRTLTASAVLALALSLTACGNSPDGGGTLSGSVSIDGSSTVAPLSDAVAEEYKEAQPDVNVNLGVSGTGGGFKRFCAGETDISNASRPIKQEEIDQCTDNGVEYLELRVATDALTVVTHPDDEFVECLTFEELATIWGADDAAENWQEVRSSFPDLELTIFAPGADSGTYDFFTEEVLGEDEAPRQDYNASEDDNIIAQGVSNEPASWGYFGFAYYQENEDALRALAVDDGDSGCVEPSVETARNDEYPLARPLFIYVSKDSLADAAVADFVDYYLENVGEVVVDVGYIEAPEGALEKARAEVQAIAAGGEQ